MRTARGGFKDLDAPAMRIDEFGDDRQANPGALDVSSLRRLALIKRLEYPVSLIRRDARSRIDDIDDQLFALAAGVYRNVAPARCELDRIREQVVENEANLRPIRERREVLDLHIEAHPLSHQRELLVLQDRLDQGPKLELGDFQAHALRLPRAEGQQVLDQALQFHSVLAQYRSDLALSALQLTDCPIHQELGSLPNIRQWSLQFMRHVSQESILLLRKLEQPHPQPLELRRE